MKSAYDMSERYWITGVQIGLLHVFLEKMKEKNKDISNILSDIEKQFIGNISNREKIVFEKLKTEDNIS